MPDTTSWPKHTYEPILFPLSVPDEPDAETLEERVLDALGASAWQISQQTFGYRLRGTDTLTWGDQTCWIGIKGIRGLLSLPERHPGGEFIGTLAIKYGALLDASSFLDHLHQLEDIYSLHNTAAVRHFLYAYPQLVEVLLDAHVYLQKYFGTEPKVTLKVVSDPEVEGMDELFAYILTSLPVDEALARLNRLDEEWFLDQLDRVDGRFNFNLEFV